MPAKWKSSSHFVPARNSRHRTACLALYKALLAVAPKVPLPADLATAFGTKRDPVTHHVRSAFRRNLADTSPRLVYPALQAGYRMLALLTRVAEKPASRSTTSSLSSSPEHAAVVSFLRDRLAERNASLAAKALHPPNSRNPLPPSSAPRQGTRPLLVKISPPPTPENPFPVPQYATPNRPLPQSELGSLSETTGRGSRRQIPRLEMAGDFPFLRLTKPQPLLLSRVLHQKNKKRVERIAAWTQFKEEAMLDAQEEDAWERTLNAFLSVEEACLNDGASAGDKATYEAAIREHGLQHLSDVLNQEREDSVARANAMRNLIRAEAALREQEEEARRSERRRWWEENQKKEEEEEMRQHQQQKQREEARKSKSKTSSSDSEMKQQEPKEKAKKTKTKTSSSDSEAKPKRPRGRPRKSLVEDHI
ncbi:hypothetical protein PG984_008244 [Apiospora sp. TS-2023a]